MCRRRRSGRREPVARPASRPRLRSRVSLRHRVERPAEERRLANERLRPVNTQQLGRRPDAPATQEISEHHLVDSLCNPHGRIVPGLRWVPSYPVGLATRHSGCLLPLRRRVAAHRGWPISPWPASRGRTSRIRAFPSQRTHGRRDQTSGGLIRCTLRRSRGSRPQGLALAPRTWAGASMAIVQSIRGPTPGVAKACEHKLSIPRSTFCTREV